jgi:hypothetical protein
MKRTEADSPRGRRDHLALPGFSRGRASLEAKLIFPGTVTQGRPDTVIPPGPGYELVHLTTPEGTAIVAQFGHALDTRGGARRKSRAQAHRDLLLRQRIVRSVFTHINIS